MTVKTAHYRLECDCGRETLSEIEVDVNDQISKQEWIKCAECGHINYCEKPAR